MKDSPAKGRIHYMRSPCGFGIVIIHCLAAMVAAAAPDFRREVLPILSEHCYQCHGPDAGSRFPRAEPLRLDDFEAAITARTDGTRAITPGDPATSTIIERILATEPGVVMPPPEVHKPLDASQIDVLTRWIEAGAEYQPHWAFEALPGEAPVPIPRPDPGFPIRSPIDAFILHELQKENLAPSPQAARETWLRRAAFDLTGLAPESGQASGGDDQVIERLLASPAFGERWAMHWMEVARYADSFGYQSDLDTNAWPWRDWVIESFNRNRPFDEFITWQLAGDLLPEATREQRLATAFNRVHRKTQEGGSVEAEFRQEGISDRIHTFGTAFLALTMECARCHDHKNDPITMVDYHSFGAFFNSIDEWGLLHGKGGIAPRPVLLLPTAAQEKQIAGLSAEVERHEAAHASIRESRDDAFAEWLENRPSTPEWSDRTGYFPLEAAPDNQLANQARPDKPGTFHPRNHWIDGRDGPAVEFNGDDSIHVDKGGASHQHDPLSVAFWMRPASIAPRQVVFHSTDGWDPGYNGYELLWENGRLRWTWQREWPGECISIETRDTLAPGEWVHVAVTYDGSSRAAGLAIFINGQPAQVEIVRDHLVKNCGSFNAIHFGARRRDIGFAGGAIDAIATFDRAITPAEAATLHDGETLANLLAKPASEITAEERESLRQYWLSAIDAETRTATAALRAARTALRAAYDPVAEIPVMQETPEPRPTYILERGDYASPICDPLPRATPPWLPPLPDGAPADRLALARWLTAPDHPLTARVTVNRFWQEMFGTGLVATSDNFGVQGEPPSHPELLDWLARDFINHGWDVKHLLRQIVTSSTYRQASTIRADLAARDPANRLFARGPAKRLTGEMLRDAALQAGGLLVSDIGGPPVRPPQPDGSMWRALNSFLPEYQAQQGDAILRRSLYTFWRRTTPPPNMMIFDAASRDVCAVSRQTTNTPLQPLVTLNDPQFVAAAGALGTRMLAAGETLRQQLDWAFHEVTARAPDARELDLLEALFHDQAARFAAAPEATATFLAASGLTPNDQPQTQAAAATTAAALLNLDAFLMIR